MAGRVEGIYITAKKYELPAKVTRALAAGDLLRIETPGGGGFGPAT